MTSIRNWLSIYSAVVVTAIATFLLWQACGGPRKFAELDVQRINVREPDGTLRMTISNAARTPGIIVRNREHPHPSRRSAGILFFNDEGTENGGLIFGGARTGDHVATYGHLSFDQYEQDQVVWIEQNEEDGKRDAGLKVADRPQAPLPFDLIDHTNTPEGRAELQKAMNSVGPGVDRLYAGKNGERESIVELKDAQGHARLVLKVSADGAASIEFRDENGKATRVLAPGS